VDAVCGYQRRVTRSLGLLQLSVNYLMTMGGCYARRVIKVRSAYEHTGLIEC
jgi:hypothetical protein